MIAIFEQHHRQHTLITVNLEEIKDDYQVFRNNGSGKNHEDYKNNDHPTETSESLKNSL
jgi:hypothetical protein